MNDIFKNVAGSVISAIAIALIFFVWNDFFYKSTDLSGAWSVETEVLESSYSKYEGMKVYYDVLINQQGDQIIGTGEKIAEFFYGNKYEYEPDKRVRFDLIGKLEKRFISKDEVRVHYVEHGRKRDSSTILTLFLNDSDELKGHFLSTAADTRGTIIWKRKH